ncbi:hypothetical protein K9M09_00075 [Patescibacteria group bacterium]|nr:hypothetical protein [Patescibacteria group bacterium]
MKKCIKLSIFVFFTIVIAISVQSCTNSNQQKPSQKSVKKISRAEKVLAEHSAQKNAYTDIRDIDDLLDELEKSFGFPQEKQERSIALIEARMFQLLENEDDFEDLTDYSNHLWNMCDTDKHFKLSHKVFGMIYDQIKQVLSKINKYPKLVSYNNYAYAKSFCGIMTYKNPAVPGLVKKRMTEIAAGTDDFNQLILYWRQCHGRLRIMNYGLHSIATNRIKQVLATVTKDNIPESFLDVIERDDIPVELKFYFEKKVEEIYDIRR